MTFDSLVLSKIHLQDVPKLSSFVDRSLKAMLPAGSDDERLHRLQDLAAAPWTRDRIVERVRGVTDSTQLAYALRQLRRELMVSLIARNSTGCCGYDEVVDTMTALAEESVRAVVRVCARELSERHGVPFGESGAPQDLLVVGMGKLGGCELNVSSDIDLIFLYSEDGETRATPEYPNARRTLAVSEFYARLARRIIPALNDVEGPGFVFRVDMRLRPNGDAGPIVCSSEMLEEYLYTQGRDWERFAWLKGRIVSEPVFASPEQFEAQKADIQSLVTPFVFRKYLDFSAISSLTKLHEMVRAETDRREALRAREGCNVKLGRGGIREIEFIVQTLQVIRGGRDMKLRGKSTLRMIDALVHAGAIQPNVGEKLKTDYVFLRDLEHALQYVDDQQTQWLPHSGETLERAAGLFGAAPVELWAEVEKVREFVAATFDGVFHVNAEKAEVKDKDAWPLGWSEGAPSAPMLLEEKLRGFGYGDASEELAGRILALVSGRRSAVLSEEARTRLRLLVQFVVERAPQWVEGAGPRVISQAEELSRYLKLLEAIAGRSTYAALLYQYPSACARVGRVLAASRWSADYVVRHPIVLDELVDARSTEMDDFTPVDWSKWRDALHEALTSAGGDQERQINLDIVFLYDDPNPDADVIYSRLVRRMMSMLTVQTSSGKLFDVDLRLRPNGENGLAVCSFEMFSRYQRNMDGNGAWLWEHQALTRARFVAGDPELGRRFEQERAEILRMPRAIEPLKAEVLEMRRKMLEGHPNRTTQFDLKHSRGGMVDVEFIVQFMVLGWSASHPELVNNFGNILLLEMSARLGLIDGNLAQAAVRAYRRYRALQHEIRLNAGESVPARVPPELVAEERNTVLDLWRHVFGTAEPGK